MLLYTNALQHGQVGPVTAVLWIGEVVAPSAVGLAVLGDSVRTGWTLPAMAAGVHRCGRRAGLRAGVERDRAHRRGRRAAADRAVPEIQVPGDPGPGDPGPGDPGPPGAQMWPSYAWPEPSRQVSAQVVPYVDEAAPIRGGGGPPYTDTAVRNVLVVGARDEPAADLGPAGAHAPGPGRAPVAAAVPTRAVRGLTAIGAILDVLLLLPQ